MKIKGIPAIDSCNKGRKEEQKEILEKKIVKLKIPSYTSVRLSDTEDCSSTIEEVF